MVFLCRLHAFSCCSYLFYYLERPQLVNRLSNGTLVYMPQDIGIPTVVAMVSPTPAWMCLASPYVWSIEWGQLSRK